MLGNFDFMLDQQHQEDYSGFAGHCEKAEEEYAQGEYETSVIFCRKAIELIVRWIFAYPDFGLPEAMSEKQVTHYERLNDPMFFKWLRDRYLLEQLDEVRRIGNDNMHSNVETDEQTALFCLKTLFELVLTLERHLWQEPYSATFFTPCYEQEVFEEPDQYCAEPESYDFAAMIKEAQDNGDAELAARWALLNKLSDRSFALAPYVEALPEGSPISRLINVLSDSRAFRLMIHESSIRLNQLISMCYGNFTDYRLINMVSLKAVEICRRYTAKDIKDTDEYISEINAKLEAMRNGNQ